MVIKVDKCNECPLIFITEVTQYCGYPINWNEKKFGLYITDRRNFKWQCNAS